MRRLVADGNLVAASVVAAGLVTRPTLGVAPAAGQEVVVVQRPDGAALVGASPAIARLNPGRERREGRKSVFGEHDFRFYWRVQNRQRVLPRMGPAARSESQKAQKVMTGWRFQAAAVGPPSKARFQRGRRG